MIRWRKQLLALTVACVALGAVSFIIPQRSAPAPTSPPPISAPPPAVAPALHTTRTVLGPSGTLVAALERLGASATERASLVSAIGRRVDVRGLTPHTGIAAQRDTTGLLRRVSLRSEPGWFVRADIEPSGRIDTVRVDLEFTTDVEFVRGVIAETVSDALAGFSGGHRLTADYADIFQWDVDLLVDPRTGDEVRLVQEVRRLRDVPDDLPAFGAAAHQVGDIVGPGRILAASYRGAVARAEAYLLEPDGRAAYFDAAGRPLRKSFLRSPLNFRRISSRFSRARRHPITRRVVPHHGVDYAADPGTPVVASADGRILRAGWDGPLGRSVRIRHRNGYVTVYGHLLSVAGGVRAGAVIDQGQVLGYVGSTGRATGPHLHYTVLRDGRPIDPLTMENPPREELPDAWIPRLHEAIERWSGFLEAAPDRIALERPAGATVSGPS